MGLKPQILSIAGLLLAMLFSCQNDLEQIKAIEQISEWPDVEIDSLQTTYTLDGLNKARIQAALVHIYDHPEEPYYEFPKGMQVEMYNKQGVVDSHVRANYAKYFRNKSLWEARYNIKAVNTQGDTMQTEHVFIDEQGQQMYTDERVQITSKDGTRIVGQDGFKSNLNFTEYTFKTVTGIFNVRMQSTDSLTTSSDSIATAAQP